MGELRADRVAARRDLRAAARVAARRGRPARARSWPAACVAGRASSLRDPRSSPRRARTPTTRCRASATTARRTRSSTRAASSTTASPTSPSRAPAARRGLDQISQARRPALVGTERPAQDAVQRRVPLLPVPGARTRRRTTSRWTRASRTRRTPARRRRARRPTSSSCRRCGTTGTSPTTPRKVGPERAQRGAATATSASSGLRSSTVRAAALRLVRRCRCDVLGRGLPLPRVRTLVVVPTYIEAENIEEFLGRRARRSPTPTSSSSTTTAPTAPPTSPTRSRDELGQIDVLRRPAQDGPRRARTAPGSPSGSTAATTCSCRSTPTSRTTRPRSRAHRRDRERRRPRDRLALRARRLDPALAVVPARRFEVGQPLRELHARACRSATHLRLPRVPGRRCSRRSTTRTTRATGYGFQIELLLPRLQCGRRDRRAPDHASPTGCAATRR